MKTLLLAGCTSLLLSACSSPGFRVGAELTLPPTIHNANVLTPLPAMNTTAYMVEAPAAQPAFQRQYMTAPAPQMPYAPPAPPVNPFGAERLPMPKAGGCGNPCQ